MEYEYERRDDGVKLVVVDLAVLVSCYKHKR